MRVGDRLVRLFGGRLGRLEETRAVQDRAVLLDLPVEREFAGRRVLLRPILPTDKARILAFARALPEHDLLFLRRDITDEAAADAWIADVASGAYSSVVATAGDDLVGYATVAQDGMTWTRHVGEVRLLVAPELRGTGLGSLLMEQAFAMAKERKLRKIVAQMTVDQEGAIRGFERLGFSREAVLRRHVIDRTGALHDLQIMALDLEEFEHRLEGARLSASATIQVLEAPF